MKNGFEWSKSGEENTFSTLISNMGQWYMIDICYGRKGKKKLHTVIYDSLKKIPFPVKKIAKDFQLEIRKGEIDYNAPRPIGHEITDEEYAYLKNDIEIMADALKIQFDQGMKHMTAGKDSLEGFKSVISKSVFEKLFPVFDKDYDKNFRTAYRGGFTWVNEKFKGKPIGEGLVFDVNSLYPSCMYNHPLPVGIPIPFQGEYIQDDQYPLYITHITCEFQLKENYIPTIQIKKNLLFKDNEYLHSSDGEIIDLYVSNIDLELIKEHYYLYNLTFEEGWKFQSKTGVFKKFIDKWMYIKVTETGAKKLLAKLQLNSLYGKFASSPNITGKAPYLKENGSTAFKTGEEEFKDPVYTPMGVFITSWARWTTITTAQKCYDRIIYCDTDSLHILGTEIPEAIKDVVDPDKLGFWKHESTFKRAKFIRQKTYVEDVYGKMVWNEEDQKYKFKECSKEESSCTELNVKCAGMPDKVKKKVTFDNFEIGFKSFGKLLPQHVNGGVVLKDTEFTIK